MEISNVYQVKNLAYFLIVLALISFLGIFYTTNLNVILTFSTIFLFILFLLINLKAVKIEYSGSCLTIRKMHPLTFKRYIRPVIELPISSIIKVSIAEGVMMDCLKISMKSRNSVKYLRISLFFFSKKQIRFFENSVKVVSY